MEIEKWLYWFRMVELFVAIVENGCFYNSIMEA